MTPAPAASPATVVVGFDGSDAAHRALRWAVDEADRRRATLRVVHAWTAPAASWPYMANLGHLGTPDAERGAERVRAEAADAVVRHRGGDGPDVVYQSVEGRPAAILLDAARRADLLVVGTRGRGGPVRALVGSVAAACLRHATVATVVVGADASEDHHARVVVGVDGSTGSAEALRWAADDARRRGAALAVVHAWDLPVELEARGSVLDLDETRERVAASAAAFVADHVVEVLGKLEALDLAVEAIAVEGDPVQRLWRVAEGSALLVVGSRGLGGFRGLILGSVSRVSATGAPCPVAVVPDRSGVAG
jgi:nucleotide-binding universal stress UspA family protein